MIINVEQKHIDHGQKNDCFNCPVALAIKENIPLFYEVAVSRTCINLYKKGISEHGFNDIQLLKSYLPGEEVKSFIWHFDYDFPVDFFSFEIELEEFINEN